MRNTVLTKHIIAFLMLLTLTVSVIGTPVVAQEETPPTQAETMAYQNSCIVTDLMSLVETPKKYLNKDIVITGTFDKYTTLGLDYDPIKRPSKDYITFLIRRPDVKSDKFIIPLPELKLIIPRKIAEKYTNLETGDEVKIYGKVFSARLNDPWVDVNHLTSDQKDLTAEPKPPEDE